MDAYEATRVVFSRIQALDPENAARIMGTLLIQDNGDKDMIRLAFGPDSLIHSLVLKSRNAALPPTSPAWAAAPPPFSRTNGRVIVDDLHISDDLVSPRYPAANSPFYGAGDLADELQISDWGAGGGVHHRRSFSAAADVSLEWRPCVYYARGYCKNGSNCRFLHGVPGDESIKMDAAVEQQCHELLLRSRSQRLMPSSAFPFSPTAAMSPSAPQSPSAKCFNFLLQQQQSDAQRAAAMLLGADDGARFTGRNRIERSADFAAMLNPGSRQIYLTFPADSTFREEDVSNYFSIYGPVQDVRIPYQQKRMFGFVTFVYPETVKLILAKGNPHFVCDARVLVKPYKEKGKVPDKFRKQQLEKGDHLSGFASPTGLDARDPTYELMLRRKLEQAAELQQAIELQGRRFSGMQLLDLETRKLSAARTYYSSPEQSLSPEDKSPSPVDSTATALSLSQATDRVLKSCSSHGLSRQAEKEGAVGQACVHASDFQLSVEHNLPESPFASPTRASSSTSSSASEADLLAASPHSDSSGGSNNSHVDMAPFKSCFLPMPRFSCGHGAVGL